jgi:hypothetical protein
MSTDNAKKNRKPSNAKLHNANNQRGNNGNQLQEMYEKHLNCAKEFLSAGNIVMAEHHYQHAEHFFRTIKEKVHKNVKKEVRNESRSLHTKNAKNSPELPNVGDAAGSSTTDSLPPAKEPSE